MGSSSSDSYNYYSKPPMVSHSIGRIGLILTEKVLWRETKTDAGWQLLKIEVNAPLYEGCKGSGWKQSK